MRTTVAVLFLMASFGGCGDDTESRPPECEEIVEACHEVDPGSGAIHECHEMAESDWSKDQCASNATRCKDLCKAAVDAGARG